MVTFAYVGLASTGAVGTGSVTSQSYTSGRRICVMATAERNNHTAGLATAWSISDTASTNTITWDQRHLSAINNNANFDSQLIVWVSSELTANETFDVTVDANDAGADTFRYRLQVVEVIGSDGTLDKVNSDQGISPLAMDLGLTAPSKGQLILAGRFGPGGNTWDAAPTDFTKFTGGENTDTTSMESADNTDATVSYGGTTGFVMHAVHMEFNAASLVLPRRPIRGLITR